MNFASDNWWGVAPKIMDAISSENNGSSPAYGGDDRTAKAKSRLSEVFECECEVFFVSTGGAANGLALSVLSPPYGMIVCHEDSHIQMDECGGPEFFSSGAKLLPIRGDHGKLTATGVIKALDGFPHRPPHGAPASALSLTQGTETGTIYSIDEISELCAVAHARGLSVHMDGARFANAVAATGAAPAELSWRAGVDVLCFGGTKNGCLAAEAIIFFKRELAGDVEFRRKRAGHLWSKMRFIAAQFDAYLDREYWLELAGHANFMAKTLSDGLAQIDGVNVLFETEINEVFVSFPNGVAEKLRNDGATFYPWVTPGVSRDACAQRLITSFQTSQSDVEKFLDHVQTQCNKP
ncbi:MAG: low specificity L-threonine aldolase [Marinicaulis sp.]|nr:low specificity L-threonine aldolase [Marinicaulis sp.]